MRTRSDSMSATRLSICDEHRNVGGRSMTRQTLPKGVSEGKRDERLFWNLKLKTNGRLWHFDLFLKVCCNRSKTLITSSESIEDQAGKVVDVTCTKLNRVQECTKCNISFQISTRPYRWKAGSHVMCGRRGWSGLVWVDEKVFFFYCCFY